jgi:hypothetical protein
MKTKMKNDPVMLLLKSQLAHMNRDAWSAWLASGSREDCSDRVRVIDTPDSAGGSHEG